LGFGAAETAGAAGASRMRIMEMPELAGGGSAAGASAGRAATGECAFTGTAEGALSTFAEPVATDSAFAGAVTATGDGATATGSRAPIPAALRSTDSAIARNVAPRV
jgi:hypothetical protein